MEEDKTLILEGKTYISSKRAAKLFGYTNDYIGQLCRKDKVISKMIGRDRFVCLSSLKDYASTAPTKKGAKAKVVTLPRELEEALRREQSGLVVEAKVESKTETKEEPKAKTTDPEIHHFALRKVADEKSVETKEKVTQNTVSSRRDIKQYKLDKRSLDKNKLSAIKLATISMAALVLLVGLSGFYGGGDVLAGLKSRLDNLTPQAALVAVDLHSDEQLELINMNASAIGSLSNWSDRLDSGYLGLLRKIDDKLFSWWRTVRTELLAKLGTQQVASDPSLISRIDENSTPSDSQDGVFISDKARSRQQIENSFSDRVIVNFGDDANSGVITPVFRDARDEDYYFLIVPVEEDQE